VPAAAVVDMDILEHRGEWKMFLKAAQYPDDLIRGHKHLSTTQRYIEASTCPTTLRTPRRYLRTTTNATPCAGQNAS